eukprot:GHVS01008551.1.p1 GENE.GHVS01008551.1~~GHVS01008551.1.p1  ORF type:complete len:510 (+),score=117.58 GHVS01008551.1:1012-2541(+)
MTAGSEEEETRPPPPPPVGERTNDANQLASEQGDRTSGSSSSRLGKGHSRQRGEVNDVLKEEKRLLEDEVQLLRRKFNEICADREHQQQMVAQRATRDTFLAVQAKHEMALQDKQIQQLTVDNQKLKVGSQELQQECQQYQEQAQMFKEKHVESINNAEVGRISANRLETALKKSEDAKEEVTRELRHLQARIDDETIAYDNVLTQNRSLEDQLRDATRDLAESEAKRTVGVSRLREAQELKLAEHEQSVVEMSAKLCELEGQFCTKEGELLLEMNALTEQVAATKLSASQSAQMARQQAEEAATRIAQVIRHYTNKSEQHEAICARNKAKLTEHQLLVSVLHSFDLVTTDCIASTPSTTSSGGHEIPIHSSVMESLSQWKQDVDTKHETIKGLAEECQRQKKKIAELEHRVVLRKDWVQSPNRQTMSSIPQAINHLKTHVDQTGSRLVCRGGGTTTAYKGSALAAVLSERRAKNFSSPPPPPNPAHQQSSFFHPISDNNTTSGAVLDY